MGNEVLLLQRMGRLNFIWLKKPSMQHMDNLWVNIFMPLIFICFCLPEIKNTRPNLHLFSNSNSKRYIFLPNGQDAFFISYYIIFDFPTFSIIFLLNLL